MLCVTTLLAKFAIQLKLNIFISFLTGNAFLIAYLIGSFRYHIGRSMSETTAMVFMMLAAWFLFRSREGGLIRIVMAICFGILGYWTRQDHLGVIIGLALFSLEPVIGPAGNWKDYWARFKLHWQPLAVYWAGGIIFGVLALCLRNWFIGAGFHAVVTKTRIGYSDPFQPLINFYLILTGNNWPIPPSIAGLVITIGTFAGLVSLVWRKKVFFNFPIGLGVSILGLLIPYLFLTIMAYPPRFSIHLLPLALLSTMILLNNILKESRIILKLRA